VEDRSHARLSRFSQVKARPVSAKLAPRAHGTQGSFGETGGALAPAFDLCVEIDHASMPLQPFRASLLTGHHESRPLDIPYLGFIAFSVVP
jgi:hypothetical protein